jgi:hypothetical protein
MFLLVKLHVLALYMQSTRSLAQWKRGEVKRLQTSN